MSFIDRYSENVAGGLSFLGSTIVLANSFDIEWDKIEGVTTALNSISYNNDPTNLIAAGAFAFAECVWLYRGNTPGGYFLGAIGFGLGDLTLMFSDAVQNSPSQQICLGAMTAFWLVGIAKYPVLKMMDNIQDQFRSAAETFVKYSPKICSIGNIAFLAPGFIAATNAGNTPLATAFGLWATAQCLSGRLKETVQEVGNYFKKTAEPPPAPPTLK